MSGKDGEYDRWEEQGHFAVPAAGTVIWSQSLLGICTQQTDKISVINTKIYQTKLLVIVRPSNTTTTAEKANE
jgi:hypothetical protein